MSETPRPRVAIVCAEGEQAGPAFGSHVLDLLEHGWDAHLLCEATERALVDQLPPDIVRSRLHPPPPEVRRLAPRPRLLARAVGATARQPRAVARELSAAPDPAARYLRAVLLALDPDVIHFSTPSAAMRSASVGSPLGGGVVLSMVSGDAFTRQDPAVDAALSRADAVHVESEPLAGLLRQWAASPDDFAVIPPADDESSLRRSPGHPPNDDALLILSIGSLTWAQGYEYALSAIALLADAGVPCRYRIVGRGEFGDAVAFARHQLGIERLVEIVEPARSTTLVGQLAWADVVVDATVVPRPAGIVLAAHAMGVPVVTTERPPAGAETAIVVPKRDPEALARSLTLLAADRASPRRPSNADGRDRGTTIAPAARLALFRDLYQSVLDRRRLRC